MNSQINDVLILLYGILSQNDYPDFLIVFFPVVLFIELPFYILLVSAILRFFLNEIFFPKKHCPYYPLVTCVVTCYNEGRDVIKTLKSLTEQLYQGTIEILIIIDGAEINKLTLQSAYQFAKNFHNAGNRYLKIIPKITRGGHASSLNLGLKLAKGELIIVLDGDCSCDNDAVSLAVESFVNTNVVGVSGTLRVRNAKKNLITRLQALEYMLAIHFSRLGLGVLNILNNISCAFGIFRKSFLNKVGGWKNGSAEDLDLTLRIQSFFNRHPNLKLIHNSYAIVHTDAPTTWFGLFKQRLRWDGDIYYIYCRRHWRILRPKFLGWKGFLGLAWFTVLFQVFSPFFITFALIHLFITYTSAYIIASLLVVYSYYLFITLLLFMMYWMLVSDRKVYDLGFMVVIPLMPVYQLVLRIWTVVAILSEIILHSHRDSSMAPWWVNRKVH